MKRTIDIDVQELIRTQRERGLDISREEAENTVMALRELFSVHRDGYLFRNYPQDNNLTFHQTHPKPVINQ